MPGAKLLAEQQAAPSQQAITVFNTWNGGAGPAYGTDWGSLSPGQLMLVCIRVNKNVIPTCNFGTSLTGSTTGWVLLASTTGTNAGMAVYAHTSVAGDDTKIIAGSATSTLTAVDFYALSGAAQDTICSDVAAVTNNGATGTGASAGTITPTDAGCFVYGAISTANQVTANVWNLGTQMVNGVGTLSDTYVQQTTPAAVTLSETWTGASGAWRSIMVAIKPVVVVNGTAAGTIGMSGSATPVPPAITSLTPNHGTSAGGQTVIIAGTHLSTTTVVWTNFPSGWSFVINSDTQITATTSLPGTPTGVTNVFLSGAGGNSNQLPFQWEWQGTSPGTVALTSQAVGTYTGGPVSGFANQTIGVTSSATATWSLRGTATGTGTLTGSASGGYAGAITPVDPAATSQATALLQYLKGLSVGAAGQMLSGTTLGGRGASVGAGGDSYNIETDQFRLTAGQLPAIIRWMDNMAYSAVDGVTQTYDTNGCPIYVTTHIVPRALSHARQGGVIEYTWGPVNPTPQGGAPLQDRTVPLSGSALTNADMLQYGPGAAVAIGLGSSVSQTQDNKNLNSMLDYVAQLGRDLNVYHIPLITRLYGESNYTGVWWGNSLAWYDKLWTYSVAYLTGSGGFAGQPYTASPSHNLLFVFCSMDMVALWTPTAPPAYFDFYTVDCYEKHTGATLNNPANYLASMAALPGFAAKCPAVSEIFEEPAPGPLWWVIGNPSDGPDVSTWTAGSPATVTAAYGSQGQANGSTGTFAIPTTKGIVNCSYTGYTSTKVGSGPGAYWNAITFTGVVATSGRNGAVIESGSLLSQGATATSTKPGIDDNANLLAALKLTKAAFFQGWDVYDNLVFQKNLQTLWGDARVLNIGQFSLPYQAPDSPATGAGAAAVTKSGTATWVAPVSGTIAGSVGLTATATATGTIPANTTAVLALTASATASIQGAVTGMGPIGLTRTATATVVLDKTSAGSVSLAGTATGGLGFAASSSPAVTLTGTATGSVPATLTTALGTIPVVGHATGSFSGGVGPPPASFVVLPDAEQLVIQGLLSSNDVLNSALGDRIYSIVPKNRTFPLARVARFGGDPLYEGDPYWLDLALLQIDVWADGRTVQARELAELLRGACTTLPGVYDTGILSSVKVSGLVQTADPEFEPPKPRYRFTATFVIHPIGESAAVPSGSLDMAGSPS